MLYTIQNSGQVCGKHELPACGMSAEVWAATLNHELKDTPGISSVRDSPFQVSDGQGGYTSVDRLVIDIDPWVGVEAEVIARVHATIGRIVLKHNQSA